MTDYPSGVDNPFDHPDFRRREGSDNRPQGRGQPLGPDTHLGGWYLPSVGGHGAALATFEAEVTPLQRLTERGRLVVVEGPPRSGKTSLINQCVKVLERLGGTAITVIPSDQSELRTSETRPDGYAPPLPAERLRWLVGKEVAASLPSDLDAFRLRAESRLDETNLEGYEVRNAYKEISDGLGTGRIVVVRLPQTDVDTLNVENLRLYDEWMVRGMIFFAERTVTQESPKLIFKIHSPVRDQRLVLSLRGLDLDEIRTLVEDRFRRMPEIGCPDVKPEVYTKLHGLKKEGPPSVGYADWLFTGVLDERIIGRGAFRAVSSIAWPEVTEFFMYDRENS